MRFFSKMKVIASLLPFLLCSIPLRGPFLARPAVPSSRSGLGLFTSASRTGKGRKKATCEENFRIRRTSCPRQYWYRSSFLYSSSSDLTVPHRFLFFDLSTGAGARKYPPFGTPWPPAPADATETAEGGEGPSG